MIINFLRTLIKFVGLKAKQCNQRVTMVLLMKANKLTTYLYESDSVKILSLCAQVKMCYANYFFRTSQYQKAIQMYNEVMLFVQKEMLLHYTTHSEKLLYH